MDPKMMRGRFGVLATPAPGDIEADPMAPAVPADTLDPGLAVPSQPGPNPQLQEALARLLLGGALRSPGAPTMPLPVR